MIHLGIYLLILGLHELLRRYLKSDDSKSLSAGLLYSF